MKKYNQLLTEMGSNKVIVYHGDQRRISKLEVSSMFHSNGNFREGVGIYFGSQDTARVYGKYLYRAEIDHSKFIDSRERIGKFLNVRTIFKILKEMQKADDEGIFYLVSDYIEVTEASEVTDSDLMELAGYMMDEEVRNFQITLAQHSTPALARAWNMFTKYDGTKYKHNSTEYWYAVINPNIKIEPVE